MATVTLNVRLNVNRDADLIQWLDALVADGENKAQFVRDAMRRAMMDSVTVADVLQEVRSVRDAIERVDSRIASGGVAVVAGGDPTRADDDGEFDAALDAIGA